jgi:hypothetical protein
VPPPIVFCAVTVSTGAATTNPVTFVICTDVAHTPVPDTNPVFETEVEAHTIPTVPVTVNVKLLPNPRLAAALLHTNNVPPATELTVGVGYPLGSIAVPLMTTGEMVSVTIRFVIVAVPLFVTTIEYVTGAPMPGDAGVWILDTVRFVVSAGKSTPTAPLNRFTCEHTFPPVPYDVFETCVAAQTTP